MSNWKIHHGDCLEVLKSMPDASVDAVVTDPPYGLAFMGKKWDYDVPSVEVWRECLRVLKPGGHMLAFAGTRTQHRMAVRIEDAGFEIRDMIAWVYSQGFPKSHRLSCDCNGKPTPQRNVCSVRNSDVPSTVDFGEGGGAVLHDGLPEQGISASGTEGAAVVHERLGKSSVEGRRDLSQASRELQAGQVRSLPGQYASDGENGRVCDGASACGGVGTRKAVVTDGVCASHQPRSSGQPLEQPRTVCQQPRPQVVRASRGSPADVERCDKCGRLTGWSGWGTALKPAMEPITVARKPLIGTVAANVLAHGTGAINVDGCRVGTGGGTKRDGKADKPNDSGWENMRGHGIATLDAGRWPANLIHDGSEEVGDLLRDSARFFYCAKASKSDRNDGEENSHPTVKPTDLMRYLVRLVTPPGGVVLDPFMGSGSTGRGAVLEGFNFIGIEREAEYVKIAEARIKAAADKHPVFNKK